MTIPLKHISVIVGNYGSGKTEVSINLALIKKREGKNVHVADLDLINPYFRTREASGLFKHMDIDLLLPPEQYLHADLPVLSRTVLGLIKNAGIAAKNGSEDIVILDVGGDDAGATVLSSLKSGFQGIGSEHIDIIQVVNPLRPFTDSFEGVDNMRAAISGASGLEVTGLIGNANLIDETTPDIIMEGYAFISEYAKERDLPLKCITAPEHLSTSVADSINGGDVPLLSIKRQLTPPWMKPSGAA